MKQLARWAGVLGMAVALTAPGHAQDEAAFYKGKTLTVLVGIETGTGFDLYGRALARHIGRHIPGEPNVVVSNMPGASGLVAFNWLANVAPRDGSIFGIVAFSVPFEPVFGNQQARFDATRFNWIGNMDSGASICLAREDSGIAHWKDVFDRELTVGAAGRAGPISQTPRALATIGGAKLKIIEGYVGTAGIKLAIERNEVQGICGISLSTVRTQYAELVSSKRVKMLLQLGPAPDPTLPGVPHVFEFARNDTEREIYNLIFGPQGLGRSFAAPPDVPAQRVALLRAAFTATMKDAQFIEDAKKTRLALSPQTGEDVQAFVARLYASPPQIIAAAKKALGR